jgi:DNA polymerase-1
VGALFGFARMLTKIVRQNRPDRLVVCFDDSAPTFRHKAYAEYKAHRKEIESELKFQLPLARDMVEAWGLPQAVQPGYEADDVIATLAETGSKKKDTPWWWSPRQGRAPTGGRAGHCFE